MQNPMGHRAVPLGPGHRLHGVACVADTRSDTRSMEALGRRVGESTVPHERFASIIARRTVGLQERTRTARRHVLRARALRYLSARVVGVIA